MSTPPQIAGKHFVIYEAYYKQIDPKDAGRIEAMQAANFLKKSGLSVVVLSRIWDLSDPNGQGYLDKHGFYVAMKLVAFAQMGVEMSVANILNETPNPPKLGDLPKVTVSSVQMVPPNAPVDWTIKLTDRLQYEELFESLKPENNVLLGNKVKGVLMDSKLPVDILGRIWELADQDKDGNLDRPEFVVAMHLVYQAMAKKAIPAVLPPELKKELNGGASAAPIEDGGFVAHFPTDIAPPPVPPLPAATHTMSRAPPSVPPLPAVLMHSTPSMAPTAVIPLSSKDWVVTTIEKLKYDEIFERSDIDRDGLVSGGEIRDVFLQSGIPQNCLAHIWSLCDTNSTGKLNAEQFALAMWMVERKKKGMDPPAVLDPIMVPPGMRKPATNGTVPLIGGPGLGEEALMKEAQPVYTNPELEMVAKEIEEILKERRQLENEVYHKEVDVRVKTGEVRSLQSELDTLAATLRQLENQRGEAQKRLDDLKMQSERLSEETETVIEEIRVARDKVERIREQCTKQEETIKEQSTELDAKKSELQALKDEETALETEQKHSSTELENMTTSLQETQLQISQIKAMFTQLQENQRQMNDAVNSCKSALETEDIGAVSDYSLKLCPDFREVKLQLLELEKPKPDPTKKAGEDSKIGFEADNNTFAAFGEDNFAESRTTGFDDSFGSAFNNQDARVTNQQTSDTSDADPFAMLHAPPKQNTNTAGGGPPMRPESPSPALPPKKAKQPPPRPAPPRPMQGPTPTKLTPSDGFGESGSSFANFDAFADTKKVVDFAEVDPFKDFRYEDVFNIEDPFADEADQLEKNSSSMDEIFTTSSQHPAAGVASNLNDFNNRSSSAWSSSASATPPPLEGRSKAAFDLKLHRNDLSKNSNVNFANFANVFQNPNSTTTTTSAFDSLSSNAFLDKGNNNGGSSGGHDDTGDLFADFNDNFGAAARKNKDTAKGAFDPFGVSTSSSTSSGSASKNNNGANLHFAATFDDDPFGEQPLPAKAATDTENNNNTNTNIHIGGTRSNGGGGGGMGVGEKVVVVPKKKDKSNNHSSNKNTPAATSTTKYSEDYSKNFDTDLEEVLKRSLFDQ